MLLNYQDEFYNHFEKKIHKIPPHYKENENFLMRYRARFPHYGFNKNCLTAIYLKEGSGEFILKDKRLKAINDHFLILNPNEGWEFVNENNDYIDVLSFGITDELKSEFDFYVNTGKEKLLDNPFEKIKADSFFLERTSNTAHYSSGKLLKHIHKLSGYHEYKLVCPDELTIEVLQSLHKEQTLGYRIIDNIKARKYSTRIETLKRLLVAYEYIHDNISEQISIEQLSLVSSLSKFHLYDSFKKAFGKTPHQYINRLKIAKAKEVLQNKNLSVSEVSDAFGYSDLAVFSKVFKKAYGRPPSHFIS